MDNLRQRYIQLAALVYNQHMDFQHSHLNIYKLAYDFVVYIQLLVSTHCHRHMDSHKLHFHMFYHLDNRCCFDIQLLDKFQMDFLCNLISIGIPVDCQQHNIRHSNRMDFQRRTD